MKTLWLCLVIGISAAVAETNLETSAVRVAMPAPLFELNDTTGAVVKLADCRSAAVIVTFFLSGDRPSERQLKPLIQFREQYGTNDLAIFGIALDSGPGAELQAKLAEWAVSFPVLRFDMKVLEGFGGITAVPTTFVLDQNRNIIERHVGFVEPVVLEHNLKVIWRR